MPSSSSAGPRAGSTSAGASGTPRGAAGATAQQTAAQSNRAGAGATPAGAQAAAAGGSTASATAGSGAPSNLSAGSGGAKGAANGGAGAAGSSGSGMMPSSSAGSSAAGPSSSLDDAQTLIPDASWDCGMPDGIPGPGNGEMAFQIDFTVAEVHDIGQTQYGHRKQIDVSGGKASGAKLDATLMDRGLDYQLTLDSGVVELEQIHILQAGGSSILMRNCGLAPSDSGQVRVVLDFEAPNSSAASWLNEGTYIGTREFDEAAKKLTLKVYAVSGAADKTNAVQIPAAQDGPHNTWGCKKAAGTKGNVVYTENVGIGDSVALGDSKRGTRNIIPITGGTTSGRVPGTVLSGGADFQIFENGTFKEIDARYSVRSSEGDIIIVRNCGPLGGLVPVFETAQDGKYAWLNDNKWLSSDPGLGIGSVNLTIYEGGQ